MKVSELISQLQQIDSDIDVFCYTEDEKLLAPRHGFRLLDIVATSVTEGEKVRGEDQIPSLKLGTSPASRKHALLEVTSDF